MSLFIIGAIVFLGLGTLILLMPKMSKKHYYLTVLCFYLMDFIYSIYFVFGKNLLGESIHFWITILTSISFILFTCIYYIYYTTKCRNKFQVKSLLLLPLIIYNIILIIFQFQKINKLREDIEFTSLLMIGITFATVIIHIIHVLINRNHKRLELERNLNLARYSSKNTDIPIELFIEYSDKSSKLHEDLSNIIFKLYNLPKNRPITTKYISDFLKRESNLPEFLNQRIIERFRESYILSTVDNMGLIDFACLIFPEFYTSNYQRDSSERFESRFFEEYYSLFRKNTNATYRLYEQLSEKIDLIIDKQAQDTAVSNRSEEEHGGSSEYAKSIVREINHCIKTPLMTIKLAIGNILKNNDGLTEVQVQKLNTVNSNVLMIESIINGYRKLVMLAEEQFTDEIVPYITTAASALNDQLNKKVKLNMDNFIEPQIVHGNNIIIVMLLPLVHNALEASPNGDTVIVSCSEKNNTYTIRIENNCENAINIEELTTDGFTTKTKGGEGLRSVRRISSALGINFSIKAYNKGMKVVATLQIQKAKEISEND